VKELLGKWSLGGPSRRQNGSVRIVLRVVDFKYAKWMKVHNMDFFTALATIKFS
jgi:hypothetical protein